MPLLKNLKIWLQYKWFYAIVILFTFFYSIDIIQNKKYHSKYSGTEQEVVGYIVNSKVDGNKVTMDVMGSEKIIVNYYLKSEKEKTNFLKEFGLGDTIKVVGIFKTPSSARVFNLFNYQNYLLSKKIYWLFDCEELNKISDNSKISYSIKNEIVKRVRSIKTSSEYIDAFILGNTAGIDSETLVSYQTNGINHLLAISGMHITLLSGFVLKILNSLNKYKKTNYFITIIFLLFYLFIINFQPSAVRATFLFILLTINSIFNLKVKTIYYFILLLCILLIYNPFYIYNLGFMFSFIISFYLIIFQKIINYYHGYLMKTFIVSLIAFLASIPILINSFFQVNLLSPLINIIFVPYISLIVFPTSILVFIFPFFEGLLVIFIETLEYSSLFLSKIDLFIIVLSKTSMIVNIFYYVVITLVLISFSQKRYYSFILLALIITIHTNYRYFEKYPKITLIDVGQGDSILVEFPHNRGNLLIDTGGIMELNKEEWMKPSKRYSLGNQTIIPYLKSIGIKEIQHMIITHGDNDHIGSAIDIIKNYRVQHVIFNSGNNNYDEKRSIALLDSKQINYNFYSKDVLQIGRYTLYFLNGIDNENENEDSLIIYTKINNKNILFMGDAGKSSEKEIITEYNLPKMDILKVGHHGSKNSTSDELLNTITPDLALISVGVDNRFNHPHQQTISKLKKSKINYFMTSINGSIRLILKDEIVIYTCL